MSFQRDIQAKLAVRPLAALTTFVAAAEATNDSVSVDSKGFFAVLFSLATDRALAQADADAFDYTFLESDDDSIFTEVVIDGQLPFRKNPARSLVIAQDGFLQTVGVFSTKRFVKLQIHGTADTTNLIITPTAIMKSELMEFTGWDTAIVPGDGLP